MASLFKEQARWSIQSIEFQTMSIEEEEKTIDVNVSTVDSIAVTKRNLTSIVFTLSRSLKIQPIEVFSLSVEMQVMIEFADKNAVEMKDDEIIQAFKEQCGALIVNLMGRISLLISEITSGNGQIPIVTPPQLLVSGE